MPKVPVPDAVSEFLARPNPAVIGTLRPDGSLHLRAVLAGAVGGTVLVDEDQLDAAGASDPGALEQLGRGVARRLRDALAAAS